MKELTRLFVNKNTLQWYYVNCIG